MTRLGIGRQKIHISVPKGNKKFFCFPQSVQTCPGPHSSHCIWHIDLFPRGWSGWSVTLNIHLHPVLKNRNHGAIPPHSPYAFKDLTRIILSLIYYQFFFWLVVYLSVSPNSEFWRNSSQRKFPVLLNSAGARTQKANEEWRLKTNEELEKAIGYENIERNIKSKRLSWLGHVERMPNERVAKTIYKWKPYATRQKEGQD